MIVEAQLSHKTMRDELPNGPIANIIDSPPLVITVSSTFDRSDTSFPSRHRHRHLKRRCRNYFSSPTSPSPYMHTLLDARSLTSLASRLLYVLS